MNKAVVGTKDTFKRGYTGHFLGILTRHWLVM